MLTLAHTRYRPLVNAPGALTGWQERSKPKVHTKTGGSMLGRRRKLSLAGMPSRTRVGWVSSYARLVTGRLSKHSQASGARDLGKYASKRGREASRSYTIQKGENPNCAGFSQPTHRDTNEFGHESKKH
jgi:hypothetical protein